VTLAGRLAAVVLGLVAAAGPAATLGSQQSLDPAYDQGIARASAGWVVSGRAVLARLDESLRPVVRRDGPIPPRWAARGYDHVGDIDVAGDTVYVPFEQPDDERGRQAMARYDLDTLTFRDATVVSQHENSFVAVDAVTGIAYSMDRFGGSDLQRYDVRADWRRLTPLHLDRSLARVQGAAVARDAVWLSTDDATNGVYRIDVDTGAVTTITSAEPVAGEGEGVDATALTSGDLHVTVVEEDRSSVTLDHFRTSGNGSSTEAQRAREAETSWPPALVYFAVFIAVAGLGAVGTVFWRARRTVHPRKR
jgi:hypothetical protein